VVYRGFSMSGFRGIALGLNGFGWASQVYKMKYSLPEILGHAAKLGFNGVELFGIPDPYPTDLKEQKKLKKLINNRGLKVPALQSLPGGLKGNPGSSYSMLRKEYVDGIKQQLDLAKVMGCEVMGVWAGELLGNGPSDDAMNWFIESYRKCAELAKKYDITLAFEAEPVQMINTLDLLVKLLNKVNSKYFKCIFDFSHVNIFTKGNPMKFIKAVAGKIGYTHVCDNDGTCTKIESKSSRHMAIGDGKMNVAGVIKALKTVGKYDGWLDIDVWEHPKPSEASAVSKKALDRILT